MKTIGVRLFLCVWLIFSMTEIAHSATAPDSYRFCVGETHQMCMQLVAKQSNQPAQLLITEKNPRNLNSKQEGQELSRFRKLENWMNSKKSKSEKIQALKMSMCDEPLLFKGREGSEISLCYDSLSKKDQTFVMNWIGEILKVE